MSLRAAILSAALPTLPRTSFTRAALSSALASLPAHSELDSAARDGVLDTVFGPGGVEGPRALVSAWEEQGEAAMRTASSASAGGATPTDRVTRVLSARLAHAAALGPHLTEAHALLAAGTPSSLPVPEPVLAALRTRLPSVPLYAPAGAAAKAWEHGAPAAADLLDRTGGRLPLPTGSPAAPLAYAWRVADAAVYAARPHTGTGVMREPRGAGVEWYTSRVGLALAYLAAESHLLQPYPALTDIGTAEANPHYPAALSSLRHNIRRLDDMRGVATTLENAADGAISLLELMTRSVAGIVRSRGF